MVSPTWVPSSTSRRESKPLGCLRGPRGPPRASAAPWWSPLADSRHSAWVQHLPFTTSCPRGLPSLPLSACTPPPQDSDAGAATRAPAARRHALLTAGQEGGEDAEFLSFLCLYFSRPGLAAPSRKIWWERGNPGWGSLSPEAMQTDAIYTNVCRTGELVQGGSGSGYHPLRAFLFLSREVGGCKLTLRAEGVCLLCAEPRAGLLGARQGPGGALPLTGT